MVFCDKKYIGRKLKEYRKKNKLTQEELAAGIGITDKHYSKLERGIFLPGADTFLKLINILNIPVYEFGIVEKNSEENILRELLSLSSSELKMCSEIIKIIKKHQKQI